MSDGIRIGIRIGQAHGTVGLGAGVLVRTVHFGDRHSGTRVLAAQLTVDGAPAARRVRLYAHRSGRLVAETRSGSDGQYRIAGLAPGRYLVVGEDDPDQQFDPAAKIVDL